MSVLCLQLVSIVHNWQNIKSLQVKMCHFIHTVCSDNLFLLLKYSLHTKEYFSTYQKWICELKWINSATHFSLHENLHILSNTDDIQAVIKAAYNIYCCFKQRIWYLTSNYQVLKLSPALFPCVVWPLPWRCVGLHCQQAVCNLPLDQMLLGQRGVIEQTVSLPLKPGYLI